MRGRQARGSEHRLEGRIGREEVTEGTGFGSYRPLPSVPIMVTKKQTRVGFDVEK